jgi:nucleoside-diphosphate-sugar epimerase
MGEEKALKGRYHEILPNFFGKRILVSGASGYLAFNLIRALSGADCTIVRLSRRNRLPIVSGMADIIDITADIREKKTWDQIMEGVHVVFHFAAQTSVYKAEEDPRTDLESNVIPMLHLLETCRSMGKHAKVIFSGTVTEAGIKLAAENYLKHYARQSIVSGVVLRLANVYGPGPESASTDRGVLNMMIKKALAGEPLIIYGKGECLRDYVYIEDVIPAFLVSAIHMDKLNANHYVIGSGSGHTIAQAANLIADRAALKTGNRPKVTHIEPPFPQSPIEERNFVADTRRFAQATGWKAQYSLIEGVDQTLESIGNRAID